MPPEQTGPASGLFTILFTDLVGSTELLSRAGDEDAQRIFRAHHDLLAEVAAAHKGEEVKWLGDGLMVAFPSAAEAVQRRWPCSRSRAVPWGERLAIRVGLNAGEALRDAADYFGTAVVVARRLCDRAEAGQILCTGTVAGLLSGRSGFAFSELGKFDLKGVPRPVAACEIEYEAGDRAVGLARHAPCVGRDAELARLSRRLAEASAGRGGVVLVAGEPGIGKTRLVEELAERARRDGAVVAWGRCFEGRVGAPLRPLRRAPRGPGGRGRSRRSCGPTSGPGRPSWPSSPPACAVPSPISPRRCRSHPTRSASASSTPPPSSSSPSPTAQRSSAASTISTGPMAALSPCSATWPASLPTTGSSSLGRFATPK